MSARADAMLRASGHSGPIISTLESDDAAFVLTAEVLLFQHLGGVRRITLRELTRIHSDLDGLLMIETPAGTALTADLQGFDANEINTFFGRVRDETARAKSLIPPGGGGSSASPPSAPAPAAPSPYSRPDQGQSRPPQASPAPQVGWTTGAERVPPPRSPAPAAPGPNSNLQIPPPARPVTPPPAPTARPNPGVTPSVPSPTPAPVVAPQARPVSPEARAAVGVPVAGGALNKLAGQANVVEGLVGRLRLLAGILFVAALGLALFQFVGGQRINGLWVVLSGGISAIALLAVADIARLLVMMSRAMTSEQP